MLVRPLISHVSLVAFSQGTAALSLIAIQVFLARAVPIEEFGQLAAALALVQLVESALVARGTEAALQLLGQHWAGGDGLLKAVSRQLVRYELVISGVGYLAFSGLALAFAPYFNADGILVAVLAVSILLQVNYGMRKSLFVLHHRIRQQAIFEITFSVMQVLVTAPLIWFFGAWGLVTGVLGSAALKNCLVHLWTRQLWLGPRLAPSVPLGPAVKRTILISSFHSLTRNILASGAANADVLLLAAIGRPESVALYRVAKSLASVPVKAATPLWVVLRPQLLSALTSNNYHKFCVLIAKAACFFAAASVVALIATALLGGTLLVRLYGAPYSTAVPALISLVVGACVLGAVTGWLSFAATIAARKTISTSIFALQLVLICAAGWFFGTSESSMALVVAGCNITVATVAWWALLTGRFRHKPVLESSQMG
jgi:O-antigen/teichoic acid export membrane protein